MVIEFILGHLPFVFDEKYLWLWVLCSYLESAACRMPVLVSWDRHPAYQWVVSSVRRVSLSRRGSRISMVEC